MLFMIDSFFVNPLGFGTHLQAFESFRFRYSGMHAFVYSMCPRIGFVRFQTSLQASLPFSSWVSPSHSPFHCSLGRRECTHFNIVDFLILSVLAGSPSKSLSSRVTKHREC
jgi:hypothetical protein